MMSHFRNAKRMALTAVLVALTLPVPASAMSGFNQQVLAAQNAERIRLGLAPMHWNEQLARSAEQWAQHLAATGEFRHAPDNPLGENIWAGTRNAFSPDDMVGAWVAEKTLFKPGVFPNNSKTHDWEQVGHYTQIVWRKTHEVGCARASNAREDVLVCRYSNPGNVFGQRPF